MEETNTRLIEQNPFNENWFKLLADKNSKVLVQGITGKEGFMVAIVMNVDSKKLGKKDIVKIEGLELKEEDVDKISLVAPAATINIIRDFAVVSKRKVRLPDRIVGLLSCINPRCITNQPREPVKPSFRVIRRDPPELQCEYCGCVMTHEEVIRQLVGGKVVR